MALLKWMGVSQPEKPVVNDVPIGLENFGNTCYCNSVLQALYYCKPFRECVLNYQTGAGAMVSHYPLSPTTPAFSIHSASSSTTTNTANGPPSSYFAPQHSSSSSSGVPMTPNAGNSSSSRNSTNNHNNYNYNNNSNNSNNNNHHRDSSASGGASGTPGPVSSSSFTSSSSASTATPQQRNIVGVLLPNGGGPDPDSAPQESMFLCLQDLFQRIQNHSKKTQYFTPTAFVAKVKKENELFRSSMHQDAHEFLMFIMSAITEDIEADIKKSQKEFEDNMPKAFITNGSYGHSHGHGQNGSGGGNGSISGLSSKGSSGSTEEVSMTLAGGDEVRLKVNGADINTNASSGGNSINGTIGTTHHHGRESIGDHSSIQSESTIPRPKEKVWVQKLFEGQLTNEIKCLTCEKTTNRAESFMDLSLDIEQNSSVTSCLRQFSASEMLCHKDKFYCDECCGLQEAEKRMKIQVLPNILSLHLKRFKYQEALQKYVKLSYRVSFPMELRLFNTVDEMEDPDRIYDLNAFVVHVGSGPHHGHYVAVVKHQDRWLLFDDENVETIDESDIHKYFGDSSQLGSGYVLFYQARDLDMSTIVPMHWAQQQVPFTLKSPIQASFTNGHGGNMSNGLSPADLDQYGGLLPHTQQQELIHQQLAHKQQQQQQHQQQQQQNGGGSGFSSLFGGGNSSHNSSNSNNPGSSSLQSPTIMTQHHLLSSNGAGGPRSPTQIQDPSMLNGQKITSGSYVYTNGVAGAAAAAAAATLSSRTSSGSTSLSNDYYTNGNNHHNGTNYTTTTTTTVVNPDHALPPPSPSAYHTSFTNGNGLTLSTPPTSSGTGTGTATSNSLPLSSKLKSSATTTTPIVPHTIIDPTKLKRAQSTPRITLASAAAKTFGGSGGKSFIGSLRGGS